jgi:predicted ATPase
MATITIKNVGPIKNVENLKLNKVNVFMGAQSSGKSTIAKIISYCSWVEKDVSISQSLDEYNMNGNFRKKLENFHQLKGYFKENTEIYYESEVIRLLFKNNNCSIEWVDKHAYKRSKIEYIPSERNLIILPFIYKVDLSDNNIRNFLFDWLTLRTKYHKENQIKILDLPVAYYFDENTGENHIISTDKNDRYDILLEDASSGLQSLIPLTVALRYLTEWIYENEEEISFEKQQKMLKVYLQLMKELVLEKYYPDAKFDNEKQIFEKIQETINLFDNDELAKGLLIQWGTAWNNFEKYCNTQFIIEEPEQNLFPSTQRDLVYHLLRLITGERDHRLIITTHSPYILYALNNCMMGYLVNSQLQGDEKQEYLKNNFLSEQSWINPKLVSIFEIEDGTLRTIQDKDNIITENYFDQKMTELTDEYYLMLNYYKNEE